MDKTTELITSYATTLRYSDLTPEAIHCTKRSFIDTLGCAIGGAEGESSKIAKRVAGFSSSRFPSRIWGTSDYSSPDMAAFANTVMVHYLNFDECWRDLPYSGGFPGRTIPPIVAVGEPSRATGREIVAATVVAYDVCYRLVEQVFTHRLGWNQAFYTGPASAAGLANLMRLTPEQTANALSLSAISALRLRQTRASNMAMWKACDCADANRDVVHYAFLAREGLTAPNESFEGKWGLWHQAGTLDSPLESDIQLEPFGFDNQSFKNTQMSHKIFPCHNHGLSPISMALELRDKVKMEEIAAINIQAYFRATNALDAGPNKPEKRDPQSREDADHSIPWLVAMALRDGKVTRDSFKTENVREQTLRPLMQKVKVTENAEFTREFPQAYHMTMEIVTRSGERYKADRPYPKGYLQNPLTDAELEEKFANLVEGSIGPKQCRRALDLLWRLEELATFSPILDALSSVSSGGE